MKTRVRKLISFVLVLTILISGNTAVVSATSSSNATKLNLTKVLDVKEVKQKLEATAIPLDPGAIEKLLEALIKALGVVAGLAVLADITGDSSISLDKAKRNKIVPIYRWGAHTYKNLTPRPKDITGLSFSTRIPVGQKKFVATSFNAVNATGKLVAILDNRATGHVSVRPSMLEGRGTMNNWIASRENANDRPHRLTRLLYSISSEVRP